MHINGRQWGIRLGLMALVAVGITACGGEQASTPGTSLPAATEPAPAQAPATASPAASGASAEQDEPAVATTPEEATPAPAVAGTPVVATPVALATPISGATPVSGATPGSGTGAESLAAECGPYQAWRANADVQAVLEKASLWPAVIAEGEKAAAGEAVDTGAMQDAGDQMAKQGKKLMAGDAAAAPDSLLLARRAMGLTSRLAVDLGEGNLDAAAAGTAVTEAKAAISAYEDDAAARQAACA